MRIFLDVGAWIGDTTQAVLSSGYVFDKIYCFEPQVECCDVIRQIEDDRIVVNEFGLWNETCTKKIYQKHSSLGASLFSEKFSRTTAEFDIVLMRASDWFKENINIHDEVVMKFNCEGAECAILDDLFDSGEYKKISVLMVDFDIKKIRSQIHREQEIRDKLKTHIIPTVFILEGEDLDGRWARKHGKFVHYWLNKTLGKV
jgi:FkbM family methyltransferase